MTESLGALDPDGSVDGPWMFVMTNLGLVECDDRSYRRIDSKNLGQVLKASTEKSTYASTEDKYLYKY